MTRSGYAEPKRISTVLRRTTSEWVGYLKCPTSKNRRSTFGIFKKWKKSGKHEVVKSQALDAINQRFISKQIPFEYARQLAKELVDQLNGARIAVQHHQGNLKVLEDYWQREYIDRDLVAPEEAYRRLLRAVEALGQVSILSGTRQQMQHEVNSRYQGNKQRRIISALNQLLVYLGRDKERLRKDREEIRPVAYIGIEELNKLGAAIEDPIIWCICKVAFGTGLRQGEIFAISPDNLKQDHIWVSRQLDDRLKLRPTKNRKERKTAILVDFRKDVEEWARYPDKIKYRNFAFSKLIRKLSKKILGKSITFHDLRHSYAIYLVQHNVNITEVSLMLGNSYVVCERYYSGFIATPETIAAIMTKVTKL